MPGPHIDPEIAHASASLTPFSDNIQRQGPGGQAYELAPTAAARTHVNAPKSHKAAWVLAGCGALLAGIGAFTVLRQRQR